MTEATRATSGAPDARAPLGASADPRADAPRDGGSPAAPSDSALVRFVTERSREPKAAPAARPFTYLMAVMLLGLSAVAVHDVLVRTDVIGGSEWIPAFVDAWTTVDWMRVLLPVSIALIVVGALVLFSAIKPRRSTHLRARAESATWLRPVDVARLSTRTARAVPGVLTATTVASAKSVTVTATGAGANAEVIRGRIDKAVGAALAGVLADPPRLKVKINVGSSGRSADAGGSGTTAKEAVR